MENFAKSILNYFATYNETRFNFNKKILYSWTNNELTLDINIFKDFVNEVFLQLKQGSSLKLTIKKGEYSIKIDQEVFKKTLIDYFENEFESRLQSELNKVPKELNEEEIKLKQIEIYRNINFEIRKFIRKTIVDLQDDLIHQIERETLTEHIPISCLNIKLIEQKFYDFFDARIKQNYQCKQIKKESIEYFQNEIFDLVVFDLFFQLEAFTKYFGADSVYLFIHDINYKEKSYPLVFMEVQIEGEQDNEPLYKINNTRNFVMLNTPAINSCEFDKILTLPRASGFDDLATNIVQLESFLNSYYQFNQSFMFGLGFHKLVADNLPTISPRIGLQVIQKDERSILDYSELITQLEDGSESKFIKIISDYVEGNVKSTTVEVNNDYIQNYPKKSHKFLINDLPIKLNDSQKKIVTAVNNPNNKVVVVDGPPGTGKSYTITALVYNAMKNGKNVVITSHKKQALDVIEDKLTEQFKELHPKAKPNLLRLSGEKEKTINSLDNTLSNAVINHASKRSSEINVDAIQTDINVIEKELEDQVKDFWTDNDKESNQVLVKYFESLDHLGLEDFEYRKKAEIKVNKEEFLQIVEKIYNLKIKLDLDALIQLSNGSINLSELLTSCELLHKNSRKDSIEVSDVDISKVKELLKLVKLVEPYVKSDLNIYDVREETGFLARAKFYKLSHKHKAKDQKINNNLFLIRSKLDSLEYKSLVDIVNGINAIYSKKLTITELVDNLELIIFSKEKAKIVEELKPVLNIFDLSIEEVESVYKNIKAVIDTFGVDKNDKLINVLDLLKEFEYWFEIKGFDKNNILSLNQVSSTSDIFDLIVLYASLPKSQITKPDPKLVNEYNHNLQKLLEFENDKKFANLLDYSGDVSRILNAVSVGRRISASQSEILLNHLSCIISPANLISQVFPMEEDIIDTLIIDEASQVSIADSISLILRAKQTVVFGDELQYGAVGAVNVSKEYSSQYFKDILDDYSKDKNDLIDEETKQKILDDISKPPNEDELESSTSYVISATTKEWLKTFSVRTSTLSFCKAIKNYSDSLNIHFRSFPEIIGYSNDKFYKESQIPLIINRIRTRPISEVLQFIRVKTQGLAGQNINLDEIEVIKQEIEKLYQGKSKATMGIICSFREQTARMEEEFRKFLDGYFDLVENNKLKIWFVGDVQGEERDIVFYSFVEDKKIGNANLGTIYPVVGGVADNIRKLKKQRLNVGFSRAKNKMVFVHSMPIEDYSDTVLGEALKWYKNTLETTNDNYIEDESVFGSPAEKELYILLQNTEFYKSNKQNLKVIAQFPISKYIADEYHRYLPNYRVDFLLSYDKDGKEKSLILEYDGLEYHFKDSVNVTKYNYSSQYVEYDIQRQLELESYGYKFLRLNKFNLMPEQEGETKVDVLNKLLISSFFSS